MATHAWLDGFLAPGIGLSETMLLWMAAYFAGVVRSPLTVAAILFEMTGAYGMILPIMLAAMLASIVAGRLCEPSIYDALAGQFLDRLGLGDRDRPGVQRALEVGVVAEPRLVGPEELPTLLDRQGPSLTEASHSFRSRPRRPRVVLHVGEHLADRVALDDLLDPPPPLLVDGTCATWVSPKRLEIPQRLLERPRGTRRAGSGSPREARGAAWSSWTPQARMN